jgi:hypothetical protein
MPHRKEALMNLLAFHAANIGIPLDSGSAPIRGSPSPGLN